MGCIIVPAFVEVDVCGDNEAGVKSIHLIAEDDLTFPLPAVDVDTRTISTDVVLVDATTAGFEEWTFLEETAQHTENSNDNGGFDHTLELVIPKDSAIKRYVFAAMAGGCCKFAAIYTDNNGVQKLIDGLSFRRDYATGLGGQQNDRNQYTLRFTKSGGAAYVYTGSIPVKTP